jgi:hypothetical protein
MMLGRLHNSITGPLWSSAKWLELAPVGTVVRNSVDHLAPPGAGTYYIKVRIHNKSHGTYRGLDPGGAEWVPCRPDGTWRIPDDPWYPLRSKDMYLPVQVVKVGSEEM